jgi:predicted nucleic acid-binding protein
MRYVLDASVAVAALRPSEPRHADALRRCQPFFLGHDAIVVPAIFDVEVVASPLRRGVRTLTVSALFARHFATRKLVTLGPRAVAGTVAVANATKLRAADSLYVWLAAREALPLVSLDAEVLPRAPLAGVTAVLP